MSIYKGSEYIMDWNGVVTQNNVPISKTFNVLGRNVIVTFKVVADSGTPQYGKCYATVSGNSDKFFRNIALYIVSKKWYGSITDQEIINSTLEAAYPQIHCSDGDREYSSNTNDATGTKNIFPQKVCACFFYT